MHTYCMNTHALACVHSRLHTRIKDFPTPSPAESFYANDGYGHVCDYTAAIMHNSAHRQQAGWYSRPLVRLGHSAWAVCVLVSLRHLKGGEKKDSIYSFILACFEAQDFPTVLPRPHIQMH